MHSCKLKDANLGVKMAKQEVIDMKGKMFDNVNEMCLEVIDKYG